MECILHIGIGKAGSSALQGVFEGNRSQLKEQGVLYPDDLLPRDRRGGDNHKCLAVSCMRPGRNNIVLQQHRVTTPKARLSFDRKVETLYRLQIEESQSRICLLSAEHFWSCLGQPSEVAMLSKKMRCLGLNTTRVIVYLRRQSEWFDSFLMQRIREGRGLLGQDAETLLASPTAKQLNYWKLVETWSECFPEAEIVPRIFAREAMVEGDIVKDFCAVAGIVPPAAVTLEKNVSATSNLGINLLLGLRERLEADPEAKLNNSDWRSLTHLIESNIQGRCGILPDDQMQAIDVFYEELNEAVRVQYFPERSSLFSATAPRAGREVFHQLDTSEFSGLLTILEELWRKVERPS